MHSRLLTLSGLALLALNAADTYAASVAALNSPGLENLALMALGIIAIVTARKLRK